MSELSPKVELENLIQAMGLSCDEIQERGDEETVVLDIITPDHAQLYGRRGRTFEALQYLLRSILWRKGYDGYVNLDLNSMKENKYEQIRQQVREKAEEVKEGKMEYGDLPQMSPIYRRVAHLVIKNEFPDLETESIEDHGWKFVRIAPKKSASA